MISPADALAGPVMLVGPTQLAILLGVVVLLFGASKLPELARGTGRALRIFKEETAGLIGDDDREQETREPRD